jgi:hypothetical protein
MGTMDEVISLRVRNRMVARQIETPRPPDPILRRPCADREEKRVTHGRDMRSDERTIKRWRPWAARASGVASMVDAKPAATR